MISDADPEMTAIIQREIDQQSSSFINGINSLLSRRRVKPNRNQPAKQYGRRLGVTVYFFEGLNESGTEPVSEQTHRRVNLRRRADMKVARTRPDASTSLGEVED